MAYPQWELETVTADAKGYSLERPLVERRGARRNMNASAQQKRSYGIGGAGNIRMFSFYICGILSDFLSWIWGGMCRFYWKMALAWIYSLLELM